MKKWYQSRTLWTNIAFIASGVLAMVATAAMPDGTPLISVRWATWIGLVIVPGINLALRVLTTKGLEA